MKLALVIGHGPKIDKGAWNPKYHVDELTFNRDLAQKIVEHAEGSSLEVVIVHRVTERVQPVAQVNALQAGACVELHCNAYDGLATGTEMICYPGSVKGRKLAEYLQDAALSTLKLKDRGVKDPQGNGRGMALLRGTNCPCVIWEPFFIDNDRDLQTAIARKGTLAKAFVQAVLAYSQAARS